MEVQCHLIIDPQVPAPHSVPSFRNLFSEMFLPNKSFSTIPLSSGGKSETCSPFKKYKKACKKTSNIPKPWEHEGMMGTFHNPVDGDNRFKFTCSRWKVNNGVCNAFFKVYPKGTEELIVKGGQKLLDAFFAMQIEQ